MEPMTMIALAKGLLSATGAGDWIAEKIGEKFGDKTADKISTIAQLVTDTTDPMEAMRKIEQSPQLATKMREMLLTQERELKALYLQDVSGAREMYANNDNSMADTIANRITRWNLWGVIALVVADCLLINFVDNKVVAVSVGTIIGGIITALLQERQQVIGFSFGSSLGSKEKTKALSTRKTS